MPIGIPQTGNVTALTFNQEELFASVGKIDIADTLIRIDPCECKATEIGMYGYTNVNGITSNVDSNMIGISGAVDEIISIDTQTGQASFFADLPGDWGSHGLTWSDPESNVLYGIDSAADMLHIFDADNGVPVGQPKPLSMAFGSVGIEFHPGI